MFTEVFSGIKMWYYHALLKENIPLEDMISKFVSS